MTRSRSQHKPAQQSGVPPAAPHRSERCERRSVVSVPVTILGLNAAGRLFHELTTTRNVSRHGCCIHLHTQPQSDTPFALQVVPREGAIPEDTSHLSYQLVWKRQVSEGWELGALAEDDADLLQLAFPAHKP